MGTIVVKCKVHFFPADKIGKKRTYHSKYRPAFKVRDDEMFNSGQMEFIGKKKVEAGQSIECYITFISPKYVQEYLKIGKKFTFCENPSKILGEGEIVEVCK